MTEPNPTTEDVLLTAPAPMPDPDPPAGDALDEAILAAIRLQPMSRRQLAGGLGVSPSVLGASVARLSKAGRVIEGDGQVGLPGSLPSFRTGDNFEGQARALWQRRGVLVVFPADLGDSITRERLMELGHQLYGRRRRQG